MAPFVNRTCDSLRGFGRKGRAIDDGNTYFSISPFPPNRSDKEWQLCTTEGPTSVFKRFGGKGRAIDGRNIYFLFSYVFVLADHQWVDADGHRLNFTPYIVSYIFL